MTKAECEAARERAGNAVAFEIYEAGADLNSLAVYDGPRALRHARTSDGAA